MVSGRQGDEFLYDVT